MRILEIRVPRCGIECPMCRLVLRGGGTFGDAPEKRYCSITRLGHDAEEEIDGFPPNCPLLPERKDPA